MLDPPGPRDRLPQHAEYHVAASVRSLPLLHLQPHQHWRLLHPEPHRLRVCRQRLQPLLIQVGSHEILMDDAVRLAARAGAADVPVQLQVWPQVPHIFQAFAALLDDAEEALRAAADFTISHWVAARAPKPALAAR